MVVLFPLTITMPDLGGVKPASRKEQGCTFLVRCSLFLSFSDGRFPPSLWKCCFLSGFGLISVTDDTASFSRRAVLPPPAQHPLPTSARFDLKHVRRRRGGAVAWNGTATRKGMGKECSLIAGSFNAHLGCALENWMYGWEMMRGIDRGSEGEVGKK